MDAKNGYYTSLYLEKSMVDLASDIDYFESSIRTEVY